MLNIDDILQKKISDLESGIPVETVLSSLAEEARDLEPLIRLAAAVRSMPHPEPAPANLAAQQQRVLAAAQANTRPIQRTRPPVKIGWRWLTGTALVAAAATTLLFFAILLAGLSYWVNSQKQDMARLENMLGQVQASTDKEGTRWKNLSTGDRLRRGQRIRTLGASTATLVFFEGTHLFIAANSDLTLTRLNGAAGHALQVEIFQDSGETWHKVTPLQGTQSYYLVSTPSGTASVRGTSFNVRVSQAGQSQFAVNTGEVRVDNNGNHVTLISGQAVSAEPSGEISAPDFQFTVQGSLLSRNETSDTWNVSGVTFKVTPRTSINGDPQLSDTIKVSGRTLSDDSWVADVIEPVGSSEQTASFTGTLESMNSGTWAIGNKNITVTDQTVLDANLSPKVTVKTSFNILEDGSWLAWKIETLLDDPENPDLQPTSDPKAMPVYKFSPDELEISSCAVSGAYNLSAVLKNEAEDRQDYAGNGQFGYLIDDGGEYVNAVEFSPGDWKRIEAGQTVPFDIRITMKPTWSTAPEDSEVKLRIYIASTHEPSEDKEGTLTITIEGKCKIPATPTAAQMAEVTPSVSETLELTGTPSAAAETLPPAVENSQTEGCTGASPHPTGLKLAQRYGVDYEKIMYWFCTYHYGFGEIELAYSLSRETGTQVEEIFAMRASGMGWGNIKKDLAAPKDGKEPKDKKQP